MCRLRPTGFLEAFRGWSDLYNLGVLPSIGTALATRMARAHFIMPTVRG